MRRLGCHGADFKAKSIQFKVEPVDAGFGILIYMVLPGEVELMLYEPKHPTAI